MLFGKGVVAKITAYLPKYYTYNNYLISFLDRILSRLCFVTKIIKIRVHNNNNKNNNNSNKNWCFFQICEKNMKLKRKVASLKHYCRKQYRTVNALKQAKRRYKIKIVDINTMINSLNRKI